MPLAQSRSTRPPLHDAAQHSTARSDSSALLHGNGAASLVDCWHAADWRLQPCVVRGAAVALPAHHRQNLPSSASPAQPEQAAARLAARVAARVAGLQQAHQPRTLSTASPQYRTPARAQGTHLAYQEKARAPVALLRAPSLHQRSPPSISSCAQLQMNCITGFNVHGGSPLMGLGSNECPWYGGGSEQCRHALLSWSSLTSTLTQLTARPPATGSWSTASLPDAQQGRSCPSAAPPVLGPF